MFDAPDSRAEGFILESCVAGFRMQRAQIIDVELAFESCRNELVHDDIFSVELAADYTVLEVAVPYQLV